MSGLVGEYLKIDHCTRVGCHDFEHLSPCHFRQGFFRSQDGQWTNKPAHIQFPVKIHYSDSYCYYLELPDQQMGGFYLFVISADSLSNQFHIDNGRT